MSDEQKCWHKNVYGDNRHITCRDCGESFTYVDPPSEKVQPDRSTPWVPDSRLHGYETRLNAGRHRETRPIVRAEPPQATVPEDLSGVTYFVHMRDGSMQSSDDPYRRDYVSYQDFCVVCERLGAAEQRAAKTEAALSEPNTHMLNLATFLEESSVRCTELEAERDRLKEQLAGVEATHRKEINEMAREHSREIRDAVARWTDRGDYGSY